MLNPKLQNCLNCKLMLRFPKNCSQVTKLKLLKHPLEYFASISVQMGSKKQGKLD